MHVITHADHLASVRNAASELLLSVAHARESCARTDALSRSSAPTTCWRSGATPCHILAERFDLVSSVPWRLSIPPAAYVAGRLARAWVAYRRGVVSPEPTLSPVIQDADRWGMRLYEAEAVELAAVHLSTDQPVVAAELLAAVEAARRNIGLHWRPSYQRTAVDRADETVRGLLAPEHLAEARVRGAASTLAASAASAVYHLTGAELRL